MHRVLGRSGGTRRQHHDRRPGRQRRCRRRSADEHLAGCRSGVPGGDEPVCRGARPIGGLGHQRRHALRRGDRRTDRRPCSCAIRAGRRLPELLDRRRGRRSAVRSAAGLIHARRPVCGRSGLFGFGALEIRNQDGGVLVGVRDPAAQHDRSHVCDRPRSTICSGRFGWIGGASSNDDVMIRYSGQREDDIAASTVERAIGTASQRQQSRNRLQAVLGSWSRILSPRAVNSLSVSFSDFRQPDRTGRTGRRS